MVNKSSESKLCYRDSNLPIRPCDAGTSLVGYFTQTALVRPVFFISEAVEEHDERTFGPDPGADLRGP